MSKSKEELKQEALEWSRARISGIVTALDDPIRGMNGEEKQIYELFQDWDISVSELTPEQSDILATCLAMEKFNKLSKKKDKPKLSKWEVVTGRRLKREE